MAPLAAVGTTVGTLRHDPDADAYVFSTGQIGYRVRLGPEAAGAGLLVIDGRVGEGDWQPLLTAAGMFYRTTDGEVLPPARAVHAREGGEFRPSARGRILTLRYVDRIQGRALRRSLTLRLVGRALSLTVAAAATPALGNYCGFTLGPAPPTAQAAIRVPGMLDPLFALAGGAFFSAYVDRWLSNASGAPPAGAFYRPKTDGRIEPILDTFYLTLSADPLEGLPAQPSEPALFRDELARRVVLDLWSVESYRADAEAFARLERYGLRDLLVIYRNWQHYGYGRRAPAYYPAAPERGSNYDFQRLGEQARSMGWRFALREEYADIAPDSPYWDPKVAAATSAGAPRAAPDAGFAIAADRMLDFARLESSKIQRNYQPNASFAGAHVGWHAEEGLRQLDAGARRRGAESMAAVARATGSLLQFFRDTHGGPLLGGGGEGSERYDTQWAGLVDAAERPLDGGRAAAVIVDYEHRHLNPVMVGFGAGVYPRFFGGGAAEPDAVDWDQYRATEVALGRVGYLGAYALQPMAGRSPGAGWMPLGSIRRAVTEYYMLRALQERSLASPVVEIRYRAGNDLVTLGEALARGVPLERAQVWRRHASGLEVWVNRDDRATWPVRLGSAFHQLPPNGWLASLPGESFLTYSALVAGNRVDVCLAPEYRFLNTRGEVARRIEGITADGIGVLALSAVTGRHDVVMVGSRSLTAFDLTYRLSERGDLSVRHRSPTELELCVLDTESGKPVSIVFPAPGADWNPGAVELTGAAEWGWGPTVARLEPAGASLQLARARPGTVYRLRLRPTGE
jgi:hypothetical protein